MYYNTNITNYSAFDLLCLYKREELVIDTNSRNAIAIQIVTKDLSSYNWDIKEKSKYIESLLLRVSPGILTVFETPNGTMELVDGRQRFLALKDFVFGKMSLSKLKVLKDLNNKEFDNIDPLIKSNLEDTLITVVKYNAPLSNKDKYDILERIL